MVKQTWHKEQPVHRDMKLDLNLQLGMCPKDHVPAAQMTRFEPQVCPKLQVCPKFGSERAPT